MRWIKTLIGLAAVFIIFLYSYANRYDSPPSIKTFLDRHGAVIGSVNTAYHGYQIWNSPNQISPPVIDTIVQTEDRYFFWHIGINPIAIIKAIIENSTGEKTRRGGSTITQQLAKILIQEKAGKINSRTWSNKTRETLLALGLELKHSKKWILERYLNSIYMGKRCYGVAAAAQVYFDKQLNELNGEEIDFLASLPKAPNRRDWKVSTNGIAREAGGPTGGPPPSASREAKRTDAVGGGEEGQDPRRLVARHFLDWISKQNIAGQQIQTTLDLNLQRQLERRIQSLLANKAKGDPLITTSVVVIDVPTGDILAMVGSRDYFNDKINGQVNAATALRQPGSTLKPFTYFAAFSKGFSPDTLIPDEPLSFVSMTADDPEAYIPQNFDRHYHGFVSVREALANSYNIPAVATVNEIGLSYYHDILKKFGITSLTKPPPHYGLAVTLGAGEVTLLELTNAYAALARGGKFLPYQWLMEVKLQIPPNPPFSKGGASSSPLFQRGDRGDFARGKVIIPNADKYAAQVTEILTNPSARLKAFGFNENLMVEGYPVAVKTGTSYNHRDNWTVGYTPNVAVGVWVGHADGSSLMGTTGATGAAPIWHMVMENVVRRTWDVGREHVKTIRPTSQRPQGADVLRPTMFFASLDAGPSTGSGQGWKVRSPLPHSRFRLHPYLPPEHQKILAEVEVNDPSIDQLEWYLDGKLLAETNVTTREVGGPTGGPPPSASRDAKRTDAVGGGEEGQDPRRLLQLWIEPTPGSHILLVVAPDGRKQTIPFHILETSS